MKFTPATHTQNTIPSGGEAIGADSLPSSSGGRTLNTLFYAAPLLAALIGSDVSEGQEIPLRPDRQINSRQLDQESNHISPEPLAEDRTQKTSELAIDITTIEQERVLQLHREAPASITLHPGSSRALFPDGELPDTVAQCTPEQRVAAIALGGDVVIRALQIVHDHFPELPSAEEIKASKIVDSLTSGSPYYYNIEVVQRIARTFPSGSLPEVLDQQQRDFLAEMAVCYVKPREAVQRAFPTGATGSDLTPIQEKMLELYGAEFVHACFHPRCMLISRTDEYNSDASQIHFYNQFHPVGGESKGELEELGHMQHQILLQLLADEPEYLFCEGRISNVHPEERTDELSAYEEQFNAHFPEGLPNSLSSDQYRFIGEAGAEVMYFFLKENIHLMATNDLEDEKRVWVAIETSNDDDDHETSYVYRENACIRKVCEFLKENPDADLAIIYGDGHNFGQEDRAHLNDDSGVTFQITSYSWPGCSLAMAYSVAQRLSLIENPSAQERLINEANFIDESGFAAIKSEKGQLAALEKLIANANYYGDPYDFYEVLYEGAVSEAVNVEAYRLYENLEGPFAEFTLELDLGF